MFNFFTNATTNGMFSMYSNGAILSKVKVPKSLFVLSSNSAAIFNFLLTLIVYFAFMIFCKITFGLHLLFIINLPRYLWSIFSNRMSYILSALFVFFRDMQYLYQIFTMLLMYMSAIFYEVKHFPEEIQIPSMQPGINICVACYAGTAIVACRCTGTGIDIQAREQKRCILH